jgi:multicomponent Na+:H+ antiporter subunit G
VIGELLVLVGAVFVLLAAVGVVRFEDVYARLHALAKASTLGVLLVITGAAVNLHDVNDITSVVLAGVLHLLASPPASNMVSSATYLAEGLPRGIRDEGPTGRASRHERDRVRDDGGERSGG